jgi:hypothetical protein
MRRFGRPSELARTGLCFAPLATQDIPSCALRTCLNCGSHNEAPVLSQNDLVRSVVPAASSARASLFA